MARKSSRYFEAKIKGRPVIYQVSSIKYRDKKGRFAKFDTRRKLSAEVYAKSEKVDKATHKLVLHERKIKKWSLGYAKRKKPVTKESVEKRLATKVKKSKGSLEEKILHGMKVFIYITKKVKKVKQIKIPWWIVKERHIERQLNIERQLDEYSKTLES